MEKRKMKPATIPKMATSLAEEKYKEEKEKSSASTSPGGSRKRGEGSPLCPPHILILRGEVLSNLPG
jgi:hypothetical protein